MSRGSLGRYRKIGAPAGRGAREDRKNVGGTVHPDSFIIGAQEEAGMPPVEKVHAPAVSAETPVGCVGGPGKILGALAAGRVRV